MESRRPICLPVCWSPATANPLLQLKSKQHFLEYRCHAVCCAPHSHPDDKSSAQTCVNALHHHTYNNFTCRQYRSRKQQRLSRDERTVVVSLRWSTVRFLSSFHTFMLFCSICNNTECGSGLDSTGSGEGSVAGHCQTQPWNFVLHKRQRI